MSKADAARELLKRRRARSSLLDFILYMRPDYVVSDFARETCAALDRFLEEMMLGLRPILLLGAPPQHGKSEIVSRLFPAYAFGRYPNLRIGGLSYAFPLATAMNRDVQRVMLSPEYHRLFPDSPLNSRRVVTLEVEAKRNSEGFEIVGHRGSYISQGVGGPLTGNALDLGIIDDPIKNAAEALSPTVKQGIWDWYVSTFLTRLSKNSGQIIMATRWAADDLTGRVMEKYARAKKLFFSAITDGKALIPELHPIDKLLETKSTLGEYFWAALYMQAPKPAGGNIIRDSWVQYYTVLPKRFEEILLSWDMTFKDTKGSDYVVGQVWGKDGANAYLLDQVRDRMDFTATVAAFIAQSNKWPQAIRKLVEDKANGPAVMSHLKAKVPGLIPVEPDGSKVARTYAVSPFWEAGNVWLPSPALAPWVTDFVAEVTTFPAAPNDDQNDAMTQALRELLGRPRGFFG